MDGAVAYLIVRLAVDLGSGLPILCESDDVSRYDKDDCVMRLNCEPTRNNAYNICRGMATYDAYVSMRGYLAVNNVCADEYFMRYFGKSDLCPNEIPAGSLLLARIGYARKHRKRWRPAEEFGNVDVFWYKDSYSETSPEVSSPYGEECSKKVTPQMIRDFYNAGIKPPRGWKWTVFS